MIIETRPLERVPASRRWRPTLALCVWVLIASMSPVAGLDPLAAGLEKLKNDQTPEEQAVFAILQLRASQPYQARYQFNELFGIRDGDPTYVYPFGQFAWMGEPGVNFFFQGDLTLHQAAGFAKPEVVEALLRHDFTPKALGGWQETPLHWAAMRGKQANASLLLGRGADVNAFDSFSRTPLHGAARVGDGAMIRFLIGRGALSSPANREGQTPLHMAAVRGFEDPLRALIEGKALIDAYNGRGLTPLHEAVAGNHLTAAQILLEEGRARILPDPDGKTPLHYAVERGNYRLSALLLENGANPLQPARNGLTPFEMARGRNDKELIKLLNPLPQPVLPRKPRKHNPAEYTNDAGNYEKGLHFETQPSSAR